MINLIFYILCNFDSCLQKTSSFCLFILLKKFILLLFYSPNIPAASDNYTDQTTDDQTTDFLFHFTNVTPVNNSYLIYKKHLAKYPIIKHWKFSCNISHSVLTSKESTSKILATHITLCWS